MARVQTYLRGPLDSSITPSGSRDRSGEIIAGAVTDTAGAIYSVMDKAAKVAKETLDESRRVKLQGEYAGEILKASSQLKQDFSSQPEKAVEALKALRASTRDEYLSSVDDAQLKEKLSVDLERFNAEQTLHDLSWGTQQASMLTQQNYLDRIQNDAQVLSTSGDHEHFLTLAQSLENERGNFRRAFGDKEGNAAVDKGLESYVHAAVFADIDKGKSFEAAQRLMGGQYDHFISADSKRALIEQVDKAQKGAVKQSAFLTAAKSVMDMVGASGKVLSGDMTIADLEEGLSQTSYDLNNALSTNADPMNVEVLRNKQQMLRDLRDAKLAGIATTAKDDPEVKGRLYGDFVRMTKFDTEKHQQVLTGTLVDLTKFQRDLTQEFYNGKVSQKTFDRWMTLTHAAVHDDVELVMKATKKGFAAGEGMFGFGQDKIMEKISGKGFGGNKIRSAVSSLLRTVGPGAKKSMAVDALDFLLDDLNDRTGGDPEQIKLMSEGAIKDMVGRAKLKARLKDMGYPVYLTVGDQINTRAGVFNISGVDADGTPVVDVSKINVGK